MSQEARVGVNTCTEELKTSFEPDLPGGQGGEGFTGSGIAETKPGGE